MRRPGDAVDAGAMVVEPGDGRAGDAHVQDDDLARVHGHRGQVVRVLLVPRQPEQGRVLRVLGKLRQRSVPALGGGGVVMGR